MARTPSLKNDHIRASYQILLSLNLAFAFSYGITMYNLAQAAYSKGTSDGYAFVYCFLRSAVRINNLLHLRSSNPAYGRLPNPGSQVGVDLAFAIPTIALAVILLLFLRFPPAPPALRTACQTLRSTTSQSRPQKLSQSRNSMPISRWPSLFL